MKKRVAYSYAILRYVHDTATSEFANVGVAVYCADERFFDVSCRSTIGRISEMFPGIDAGAFRSLMRHISNRRSSHWKTSSMTWKRFCAPCFPKTIVLWSGHQFPPDLRLTQKRHWMICLPVM